MQKRRLDQRGDDEHVHGRLARKSGVTHLLRDAQTAIDFHGAGVTPLHLRQELRRRLLLEQDAVDASPTEVDGERQADRSGADDQYLAVQAAIPRRTRNTAVSAYAIVTNMS